MIGIVIVAHGKLANEFISITEFIIGKKSDVVAIPVDAQRSVEEMREEIAQAIKMADKGKGVLILTDMFGGTPSNLVLSFLEKGKVEVLSGVNLPMLLKLSTCQDEKTLEEMCEFIKDYGRKNISLASEILAQKK